MAYTDLSGSKLKRQLGAALNESVAAPVASFAKRQMEKMGWTEGTGLGRNRDGMSTHVRVRKREDGMGLGHEKKKAADAADQWWSQSVGETLARLSRQNSAVSSAGSDKSKKEKKRERKKRKKEEDGEDFDESSRRKKKKRKKSRKGEKVVSSGEVKVYTDQELFVATGGARFGMRAQRRAEGKWARTESGSELWEKEEEAKRRIEWNGLGGAKVLLGSGADGETDAGRDGSPATADHGAIEEKTLSSSRGKHSKKGHGDVTALAEVTPTTSADEGSGESAGSKSDRDLERRCSSSSEAEKQARRKKKKERKEKKKAKDDSDVSRSNGATDSEDEGGDKSPENASSEADNDTREKNKKEKKRQKKEKKESTSDATQGKKKKRKSKKKEKKASDDEE